MAASHPIRTTAIVLEVFAISYAALSLVATFVIVRSGYFEKHQAVLQTCVVWVLPVIGAVAILIFHSVVHRNMTTKAEPHRASNNSDDPLAADLYAELDK